MLSNYYIYLMTLPKEEAIKQIFLILAFFVIMLAICGFLKYLKFKYMDKNKNTLFQKFLKKL